MTQRIDFSGRAILRTGRLIAALGLFAALPASAFAQAGVALLGGAYDADSDVSVQTAIVTLEGYGSTRTSTEGRFRFRGVASGDYRCASRRSAMRRSVRQSR